MSDLLKARKILGLSSRESVESVKAKFRLRFSSARTDEEKREIISAYRFVLGVLESFEVDLEDALRSAPLERLKRRFSGDWLSGRLRS